MATSKAQSAPARSTDEFEFAPGWMPEDGERIVGTVVERSKGEGEFGEYVIITLRPEAGQTIGVRQERVRMEYVTDGSEDDVVAVHCFGTVLDNGIRKLRPQVGQRIGFRKIGKQLRKGGDESNTRDWFNAWQIRDFSAKSDDDIYGAVQKHDTFDEEPDF